MDLIRIIESKDINKDDLSEFIPRSQFQIDEIKEPVLNIINKVKNEGDQALVEFTEKFDGVKLNPSEILTSEVEIKQAYESIDKELLEALRYAKKNLIKYHKQQIFKWDEMIQTGKQVYAEQIQVPLESVGLYIPGGRAVYPSTVLMAATPAFVAGVENIIICSPPQENNKIAPEILVAASEFGIKKIYKVGGAQAIAAMAFGTETIPSVQKVVGPGNKWVNAAKQLLSNVIAIDCPAGPSEVLIMADETSNYRYVIVDLISQVEHDPDNIGIIITDSSELIEKIKENLEEYVDKSLRKDIIESALKKNSLIIKVNNTNEFFELSNLIAPEHLEILIKNERWDMSQIKNAGAVFIGPYAPVPLGDYCAGTNHILPTGGAAARYSGLNVLDFIKFIDVLEASRKGLQNMAKYAMKIAEFEGLDAHKKAIEERLKDKN